MFDFIKSLFKKNVGMTELNSCSSIDQGYPLDDRIYINIEDEDEDKKKLIIMAKEIDEKRAGINCIHMIGTSYWEKEEKLEFRARIRFLEGELRRLYSNYYKAEKKYFDKIEGK